MTQRTCPRPLFWLVWAGLLAVDQASKHWIIDHYMPGQASRVIPGLFNLVFVTNDGMAFGLFQGNNVVLGIVALLLLGGAILYGRTLDWSRIEINLCAAAIAAGAAGNLIDRVRHGYVVDFADFYLGYRHWPAFNVADACITLTVLWILVRTLFGGGKVDQSVAGN